MRLAAATAAFAGLPRLIPVVDFFFLAMAEQRLQWREKPLRLKPIQLLLVMVIHKAFHRINGGIDGARAENGGDGAGQPAGDAPDRQKPAVLRRRQQRVQEIKMPLFRRAMAFGEFANGWVAAEGKDAAIDHDRAGFPSMIGTQFPYQPGGHFGDGDIGQGRGNGIQRPEMARAMRATRV